MFVDFVTLMLLNMVAGLLVIAAYLWKGLDEDDQRKWSPAFGVPGFVALMNGFHMSWTWPLPGSYNVAFGEMTVLLGALMTGAAVVLWNGWDLRALSIYAFVSGLAAIVTGIGFIKLELSQNPVLSGIGFVLPGLGGVFAGLVLGRRQAKALRVTGAVVLTAAALIWAYTGYTAVWGHLSAFGKWMPSTMK